jgi:phosphatidylglycerophosphatase A
MNFLLAKIISTFFFVGQIKKAPGTFGTIAGILVIFPIFHQISLYDFQYILYATFVLGTIATHKYIEITKRLDPKEVVIDEVVGVWIALFFVKFFTPEASDLLTFSLSFLLFRFFDILKPFPISYLDKNLKNALGVMLDDVLAGIFAGICTVLLIKVL